MTTLARKAEVREMLVKFIKASRSESRRAAFRKLHELGVEYLRGVRSGQFVHLYGVDGDGDARYQRFAGGSSDTAYDSDWMHFSDVMFAATVDGDAIYPTAQAQVAAQPQVVADLVDDKTKEAVAKKTTDALMADTQKSLDEIKDLDGKLAYQHALKVHLRDVIQGRIAPIMGTVPTGVTGVDEL